MSTVRHTWTFQMDQPADRLFPLFSAEGETLWVPGWAYENVMGTTEMHEDYVFLTKSHDHAGASAVWIVKRHEPERHLVELYRVEPDDKVGLVVVQCAERAGGGTDVTVTYAYTALSAAGEAFIEGFTEAYYREFIGEWKTLLDAYFAGLDA